MNASPPSQDQELKSETNFKLAFGYGNGINLSVDEFESFRTFVENNLNKPKQGNKREAYFIRGWDVEPTDDHVTKAGKHCGEGQFRSDRYLNSATLLLIDGDSSLSDPKSAPPLQSAHLALVQLGINHAIHTTHSHTEEKNRWRALIPCVVDCGSLDANKKSCEASYLQIIQQLQDIGLEIKASHESRTWTQPWYMPRRNDPSDGLYEYQAYFDGEDYAAVDPTDTTLPINKTAESSGKQSYDEIYEDIKSGAHLYTMIRKLIYMGIKDGDTKPKIITTAEAAMELSPHKHSDDQKWQDVYSKIDVLYDDEFREHDQDGICGFSDDYIEPEWTWYGRFEKCAVNVLAGKQGTGKSALMVKVASQISVGGGWPMEEGKIPGGTVAWMTSEESKERTLSNRIKANGGDKNKIKWIPSTRMVSNKRRFISIAEDFDWLDKQLDTMDNCQMLVIDGIISYAGGKDTNSTGDMRLMMSVLNDLAEKHNISIVGIMHINKKETGNWVNDVQGSTALTAVPRCVNIATKDPTSLDGTILFGPCKVNNARLQKVLKFKMDFIQLKEGSVNSFAKLEWLDEYHPLMMNDIKPDEKRKESPFEGLLINAEIKKYMREGAHKKKDVQEHVNKVATGTGHTKVSKNKFQEIWNDMAGKVIHEGWMEGQKKSVKFWKLMDIEVEGFSVLPDKGLAG